MTKMLLNLEVDKTAINKPQLYTTARNYLFKTFAATRGSFMYNAIVTARHFIVYRL